MDLTRDPNKGPIKDPRGTPIQEMSILIVALLYLFHKTAVLLQLNGLASLGYIISWPVHESQVLVTLGHI